MDKIQYYLENTPLIPLLFVIPLLAAGFLAIPARKRLWLSCMALPFWLSLNIYPELDTVSATAKAGAALGYLALIVAAGLYQGQRRQLHPLTFLFPVLALLPIGYGINVVDRAHTYAHAIQFVLLSIAALLLVRTIVDIDHLVWIVEAFAFGMLLTVGFMLLPLAADPLEAFRGTGGRFIPYGAGTNSVSPYLIPGFALCLTVGLTKRGVLAGLMYFTAAISAGLALVTASRSAVYPIAILVLPFLARLTRRPLVLVVLVALLFAGVSIPLMLAEGRQDLERLLTLQTGRLQILRQYFQETMERPIFGLAFSSGESAWASQDIAVGGADPHNVFLKWLWIGGLSYFLPWLALTCVSAWSAIRVWTARQYYQRRELVTIMVLLLFAMYLHGLTSPVIITSNHFLAFLHVFLAMLFINWASDVSQDIAVHNGAILE